MYQISEIEVVSISFFFVYTRSTVVSMATTDLPVRCCMLTRVLEAKYALQYACARGRRSRTPKAANLRLKQHTDCTPFYDGITSPDQCLRSLFFLSPKFRTLPPFFRHWDRRITCIVFVVLSSSFRLSSVFRISFFFLSSSRPWFA